MSLWLWTFWTYSFLGYLLERGYAIATHADRQARKCFLLLPMCPVYGLGALAVLALPEKYRLPVHLFYYEDYSVARIAEILHSREGTVKSQLNRGRQLLKTKLMEAWNDDE